MDIPNIRTADKTLLAEAMQEARNNSIHLLDDLAGWNERTKADTTRASHPLHVPCLDIINPPLWELGHVAWFTEYWCRRYQGENSPLRASLLKDADRWYDSRNVAHDSRWQLDLPDWTGTRRYLENTLADALDSLLELPDTDAALYFHRLALLHEDMHDEAFRYTRQTLSWPSTDELYALPPLADIELAGGEFLMGSAPAKPGFVFDNEKWAHPRHVERFAISASPTKNSEYLAFVEADGYQDRRWWSDAGRAWLLASGQTMPRYWRCENGRWQQRRFADWIELAPDQAVIHLTAHEADAWCRWAGRRLPSESEWEFAALQAGPFDWGSQVWEWTASAFAPYPGFSPDPYAEYAAPFFHSHRSVRGGSFATRERMRNPRYRNYYEAHRDDIFIGFRSCRND
ncbi:MAG: SUMF1/EgtB/PvdO family nonheme iron enzyme [Burkholderiaceae bacterium]|nr:SUMF1/EgtB/PvdO family nonheme iron enzyme [Sulfuritalea sp.]MCF8174573.1 SUMF1/EgtB/PvdO family nonheme iron enzyme [Burkholderiaceae bacterium]MCF8184370.1 SUMF1/EgtB/PvdO family nonheme iron enzyme [Polynucleobacter sp.]